MRCIVKISMLALIIVAFSLSACQRVWYFTITDISDQQFPHFCISSDMDCTGTSMGFDIVDFYEVTSGGQKVRTMWIIEPKEDYTIKNLTYGVAPTGWKELQSPIPIETDHWYTIHYEYFFRLYKVGNTIKTEVLTREEFYSR